MQGQFLADSSLHEGTGDDGDRPQRRAAVYARTSSASQRFGHSLEEQIRQCVERCNVLDWTVSFVYRDEAESGKDTDRPMFQEMLDQAERGTIDVVVFWKLDRFSRSIIHAVQIEKQFRDWNVGLHSVTEQIDTTTPAGQFNFRNLANSAEFERQMIRQRSQMGHSARAMRGGWPNGTPPLGYELSTDGLLQIDDGEADVVRWIFEYYISSKSMAKVADRLNSRDSNTSERAWRPDSVSTVLRNRLYIGQYSVGNVEREIPEYQIVEKDIFDEAARVRNRFESSNTQQRESMDVQRKSQYIGNILDQYGEWINKSK